MSDNSAHKAAQVKEALLPSAAGPRRLVALYLGAFTAVIGSRRVTIHRHTRGTLNLAAPIFGIGVSG
jgi:hypothetical protein